MHKSNQGGDIVNATMEARFILSSGIRLTAENSEICFTQHLAPRIHNMHNWSSMERRKQKYSSDNHQKGPITCTGRNCQVSMRRRLLRLPMTLRRSLKWDEGGKSEWRYGKVLKYSRVKDMLQRRKPSKGAHGGGMASHGGILGRIFHSGRILLSKDSCTRYKTISLVLVIFVNILICFQVTVSEKFSQIVKMSEWERPPPNVRSDLTVKPQCVLHCFSLIFLCKKHDQDGHHLHNHLTLWWRCESMWLDKRKEVQ